MPKIINLATTPTSEIIKTAVEVLSRGGLVIFPTETLYGIGADATNQAAIDKLLQYKSRREGKPLSIAVNSLEMAEQYVEVNKTALNLYQNFLPGPLTVVSKSLGRVAKGVESEIGTLGVRIPDYQLVLDIVTAFGKPITATSAWKPVGKSARSIQTSRTGTCSGFSRRSIIRSRPKGCTRIR
jgi:L-threonylcarbamoyladenylate synthase